MEPGADRRHHEPRLRPGPGVRQRALPAAGATRPEGHRRRLRAIRRAGLGKAERVLRREGGPMKAIVVHRFGPPEVLTYEDVPDPRPRAGEIRIRVHAATVNRVLDVRLRAGKETRRAPVLPLIPGVDCAGTVDALGPGVTRWKVGQHVAAAG